MAAAVVCRVAMGVTKASRPLACWRSWARPAVPLGIRWYPSWRAALAAKSSWLAVLRLPAAAVACWRAATKSLALRAIIACLYWSCPWAKSAAARILLFAYTTRSFASRSTWLALPCSPFDNASPALSLLAASTASAACACAASPVLRVCSRSVASSPARASARALRACWRCSLALTLSLRPATVAATEASMRASLARVLA
mmetsp:Transcript_142828/g.319372  ORF Transcript_142828/g.319372 Transcript_142828/m.319372 type:complete len:201 (+) Transcript_142828:565-1167(+)